MTEPQNPDQIMPTEGAVEAQFQIQKLYTKDVSFEVPNSPQVFQEMGQADVKMNLAQRVQELGENAHEVVLTVTVTATTGEKTAYLAEVAQAGIFTISGFNDQAMNAVINTLCPNTLFPYARQVISSLILDGGFPPLPLQPVNFEQLYAQRMQQMMQEQKDAEAGQGNGGAGAVEIPTGD